MARWVSRLLAACRDHRHGLPLGHPPGPGLWAHPRRFDPDRFTPDQVKKRPKGTYFPFGLGPQNCIGDRFATMEATLALSAVCRRVRLSDPQGPVGRKLGLTMRPVGLSARITPR